MQRAYVDESQIGGTGSGLPFVLTASFTYGANPDDVRNALRASLPKGAAKLHWKDADERRRTSWIDLVGGLELIHISVVQRTTIHESPERSRRACMEMLLYELAQMDVTEATFESRGKTDDKNDMKMVFALRNRRVIPAAFRVDHLPGPAEPLLWVPDIVNGAVGTSISHGGPHGLEHQAWVRETNQGYYA